MSKSLVIIPTINERKNLEFLLPEIFNFIVGINVLVVDDASVDGTQGLIKELGVKYNGLSLLERVSNPGYGKSSLDGFKWALENGYDKIVTMDADFSHDFHNIPLILKELDNHDIVIGSRYIKGGNVKNWSLKRKMLSRFANSYVRTILTLKIHDVTAGFNGYTKKAFESIDFDSIHSEGYAFLVELKYRLLKKKLVFKELPIIFYERREGQSKMSSKVIWESIWMPWRLLFAVK